MPIPCGNSGGGLQALPAVKSFDVPHGELPELASDSGGVANARTSSLATTEPEKRVHPNCQCPPSSPLFKPENSRRNIRHSISQLWYLPLQMLTTFWAFILSLLNRRAPANPDVMSTSPGCIFGTSSQSLPQSHPGRPEVGIERQDLEVCAPLTVTNTATQPNTMGPHLPSAHPLHAGWALPIPDQTYQILSSWSIHDPLRRPIPASFEGNPKSREELLRIQYYKCALSKKYSELSEKLVLAESYLNECQQEEVMLGLDIEARGYRDATDSIDSLRAVATAKASRMTLNATRKVYEIRLAQAQLVVQQLVDSIEETSVATLEADQQLYSILAAFIKQGWSVKEIPQYVIDSAILPIPPTLSHLKAEACTDYQ